MKLGQSPLLDRLAERVEFETQLFGDFFSALTGRRSHLLRLGRALSGVITEATCPRGEGRVERLYASCAILVDAANDAVLRDAEGSHDIHLAAGTQADQLGGKHPKTAAIVLGVLKHRLNAAEVCPLAMVAHDADNRVDALGTVGDQR